MAFCQPSDDLTFAGRLKDMLELDPDYSQVGNILPGRAGGQQDNRSRIRLGARYEGRFEKVERKKIARTISQEKDRRRRWDLIKLHIKVPTFIAG